MSGLVKGFQNLNDHLTELLDRHHTIGHSFFMDAHFTEKKLRHVWRHQLEPLIEEYFFDQSDVAAEFSLQKFWPAHGDN